MRAVAGFGTTPGNYYLKRGVATPPESLQRKIWPWIEGAVAAYAAGKIPNPDLAGMQFLELLKELRVVLLQDAAILIKPFPEMLVWRHPVFADPDWTAFAEQVLQNEAVTEEPADIRIRGALPAIAEGLASLQTSLSGLITSGTSETRSNLSDLRHFISERFTDIEMQVGLQQRLQGLLLVPPEAVKPLYVEGFLERAGNATAAAPISASAPVAAAVAAAPIPILDTHSKTRKDPPTGCPEGCSAESIGPVMESVAAVYQEWYWGLEGKGATSGEEKGITKRERMLSVVELDRRWPKGQWRYTSALRTRWQNRKKLVLAIDEEAERRGVTAKEVVEELSRLPHSADKIVRLLKQQKPLSTLI